MYIYLYVYLFIYAFIPSAGIIHGFVLIQIVRTYKCLYKNILWGKTKTKMKKKKNTEAQIGTNVRASVFKARLLARSHFASGRS
jgi:hypothetical protein